MDIRRTELSTWAKRCITALSEEYCGEGVVETVSGDASFRRYFRLSLPAPIFLTLNDGAQRLNVKSLILVDAPPEHEDSQQFVAVADLFRGAGLQTPRVLMVDYIAGFMLLEDFGDELYLPRLADANSVDELYAAAIDALVKLQTSGHSKQLPPFDRAHIRKELQLFDDWFCTRFLNLQLDDEVRALLNSTWCFLEDAALAQPQVCVHRDYHSRNLMVLDGQSSAGPGVIDFQDAVSGPYTYDLVSLLRDCYIVWPAPRVEQWALGFAAKARNAGIINAQINDQQFMRDFDLMGLQRHIKVIGIFCRLNLRDNKPRYMDDIPVVMDYVVSAARAHPELAGFLQWFETTAQPLATAKLVALKELSS